MNARRLGAARANVDWEGLEDGASSFSRRGGGTSIEGRFYGVVYFYFRLREK